MHQLPAKNSEKIFAIACTEICQLKLVQLFTSIATTVIITVTRTGLYHCCIMTYCTAKLSLMLLDPFPYLVDSAYGRNKLHINTRKLCFPYF